jgi:aquaporin Z
MNKYFAELFGTFALVFVGTGAIIADDLSGGAVTHVGVSLTFGLIVLAMIYTIGEVSGAHLNPAVTLGFWAAGRFEGRLVLPYISSQSSGALAASLVLLSMFPQHPTLGTTIPTVTSTQAFVLESILTWILMMVILGVSTQANEKGMIAGVAVGAVIALEALFAGPISGASMNPARSLAPALASRQLEALWVYLAAPVTGALLAIPICRCVHEPGCCPSRKKKI